MNDWYSFKVGVFEPRRQISVYAPNPSVAITMARALLDSLPEITNDGAPEGWTLELTEVGNDEGAHPIS